MNIQYIVSYAVSHTGLPITVTDALPYINKRRNEITDIIKEKVNKGFFWEEFTTDMVAGQREYNLPTASDNTEGVQSVESIEIAIGGGSSEYKQIYSMPIDDSYYNGSKYNQSKGFFMVKDSSILLFPTPTESIVGGIKMRATTTLKDITEATIESEVFGGHTELRQYIHLIAEGLCVDLYTRARQYDDKSVAQSDYDLGIRKMIKALGNREHTIGYVTTPDLSIYE